MILLDTHTLLWRVFNPELISEPAREKISIAERLGASFISSITLWEIGIKIKNGKLEIPLPLNDLLEKINKSGLVRSLPVTDQIWLENLNLEWDHKDPADRTIVATARINTLTLITKDEQIRKFSGVTTLW